MSESNGKYSAAALDEFLAYLGEKGLMAKPTVSSRRAACNKMLSVLDAEETADVRALDIEQVARRFHNLEGKNYTPDSLKTYKSRVSKAIEDFQNYLSDPMTFKPKSSTVKKIKQNQQ